MRWFKGKYKHLLILGGLAIFLLAANPFYVRFVLKNGKPLTTPVQIPATSPDVVYKLGDFLPVVYDGQNLYQLKAYAFIKSAPELNNTITAVLRSPERQVAFPTLPQPHPNMIESYKGYTPAMDQAEFILLLSNNALPPGTYQLGFLLEEKGGTRRAYVATGAQIIKTPNTIRYVAAP